MRRSDSQIDLDVDAERRVLLRRSARHRCQEWMLPFKT